MTVRKPTGQGWAVVQDCPACGRPPKACRCQIANTPPSQKPTVRLRMERRRGKPVTVLACSGLPSGDLAALLREVKTACAAGGTLREEEIEIQGEHRDRIRGLLASKPYLVKG